MRLFEVKVMAALTVALAASLAGPASGHPQGPGPKGPQGPKQNLRQRQQPVTLTDPREFFERCLEVREIHFQDGSNGLRPPTVEAATRNRGNYYQTEKCLDYQCFARHSGRDLSLMDRMGCSADSDCLRPTTGMVCRESSSSTDFEEPEGEGAGQGIGTGNFELSHPQHPGNDGDNSYDYYDTPGINRVNSNFISHGSHSDSNVEGSTSKQVRRLCECPRGTAYNPLRCGCERAELCGDNPRVPCHNGMKCTDQRCSCSASFDLVLMDPVSKLCVEKLQTSALDQYAGRNWAYPDYSSSSGGQNTGLLAAVIVLAIVVGLLLVVIGVCVGLYKYRAGHFEQGNYKCDEEDDGDRPDDGNRRRGPGVAAVAAFGGLRGAGGGPGRRAKSARSSNQAEGNNHVAAWNLPGLDYLTEEQTLKYVERQASPDGLHPELGDHQDGGPHPAGRASRGESFSDQMREDRPATSTPQPDDDGVVDNDDNDDDEDAEDVSTSRHGGDSRSGPLKRFGGMQNIHSSNSSIGSGSVGKNLQMVAGGSNHVVANGTSGLRHSNGVLAAASNTSLSRQPQPSFNPAGGAGAPSPAPDIPLHKLSLQSITTESDPL